MIYFLNGLAIKLESKSLRGNSHHVLSWHNNLQHDFLAAGERCYNEIGTPITLILACEKGF